MTTNVQIAAKLLRDAAVFFRKVGDQEQNHSIKEQMYSNASVYEQVADLVEEDPTGIIER